jgi:hypothetical protein
MSDTPAPNLPEDPAQWPSDPYRLLGVAPGVGPRDLRLAYTRLIRIYKPEQYPEQFRRIRAAYEAILQEVQFGTAPARSHWAEPPAGDSPVTLEPPRLRPTADFGRELDQLWELACAGQEAAAYQRLLDLAERDPASEEVLVRLYWLLAFDPALDPDRAAADWLVRGLKVHGWRGRCRDLYRNELRDDAAEAVSHRCIELLQCHWRAEDRAELLHWRWRAAGRLQWWDVIQQDLHENRSRLQREDGLLWTRLLFLAVDQLAWARQPAARETLQDLYQELQQLETVYPQLGDEFDRLEYLRTLAFQWADLSPYGPWAQLASLIPLSWNCSPAEYRLTLQELLAQIVREPTVSLNFFDRRRVGQGLVVSHFQAVLRHYSNVIVPAADPGREDAKFPVARTFFHGLGRLVDYGGIRPMILSFCLRELIHPRKLAEFGASRPELFFDRDYHLSHALLADVSMQIVYEAYVAFWSSAGG